MNNLLVGTGVGAGARTGAGPKIGLRDNVELEEGETLPGERF